MHSFRSKLKCETFTYTIRYTQPFMCVIAITPCEKRKNHLRRTWEKDKTVEFSDSLVNNEATTKKKKINATTFVRYLKFTPGTYSLKSP